MDVMGGRLVKVRTGDANGRGEDAALSQRAEPALPALSVLFILGLPLRENEGIGGMPAPIIEGLSGGVRLSMSPSPLLS